MFELAVSPGVANKQFTPKQMITLAEVVGEKGTMEYTPNHKIILKIPTAEPEAITEKLQSAGFLLSPIGDVLTVKHVISVMVKKQNRFLMRMNCSEFLVGSRCRRN